MTWNEKRERIIAAAELGDATPRVSVDLLVDARNRAFNAEQTAKKVQAELDVLKAAHAWITVSGMGDMLLGDAEAMLRREVDKLRGGSVLDRLVVGWLLPDMRGADAHSLTHGTVAQWHQMKQGGAPRSYQAVTALALASAMNTPDVDPTVAFNEGIDWALGAATEVDGAAVGLAADPPAILAVVSALLRSADSSRQAAMRTWLGSVLDKFDKHMDTWERAQLHVAAQLLGEQRPQPPELSEACCVTRVAVASDIVVLTAKDQRAVTAAVLEHHARVDQMGATFLLAALSRVKVSVVRTIRTDVMTWIKTSERMPPRGSVVLVLFDNGHIGTGQCYLSASGSIELTEYAVAWMPLPEAPK